MVVGRHQSGIVVSLRSPVLRVAELQPVTWEQRGEPESAETCVQDASILIVCSAQDTVCSSLLCVVTAIVFSQSR